MNGALGADVSTVAPFRAGFGIETSEAARARESLYLHAHHARAALPVFLVVALIAASIVAGWGHMGRTSAAAPAGPTASMPREAPASAAALASTDLEPPRGSVSSLPHWATIGRSVQGRPILLAHFGSGPRRVLIVGGVHGNEFGASLAEAFAEHLAGDPQAVPPGTQVDIVACLNPDGWAAGTRANADGVDLNRNLPTGNWAPVVQRGTSAGPHAASEPETVALLDLLGRGYCRVISLHSAGGIIDYDGPGGAQLATQIEPAWSMPVIHLASRYGYTGTLGQYASERYGIPVITVELLHPRLSPHALAGLLAAVR